MAEKQSREDNGSPKHSREKVRFLPIREIKDFPDHPFQVKDDDSMQALMDSIESIGVQTPVIARKIGENQYELISGHRRKHACEKLGIDVIPIIVREMSRDDAIIEMVDSNLQREHILPSEKAKAYKMKMDALKRQGQRTDLTCAPVEHKLQGEKTRDVVARESDESREQIRRYIRLNELTPQLLDMVDNDKIAFRPAVELSYLQEQEQKDLLETIESEDATPSLAQAIRMKELSREGKLDMDAIFSIMTEEKANQKEKIKIPMERLEKYFRRGTPPKEIEDTIVKAMDYYHSIMNRYRNSRSERGDRDER